MASLGEDPEVKVRAEPYHGAASLNATFTAMATAPTPRPERWDHRWGGEAHRSFPYTATTTVTEQDGIQDHAIDLFTNTTHSVVAPLSYRWDFGDSFVSFQLSPKHLYLYGGT